MYTEYLNRAIGALKQGQPHGVQHEEPYANATMDLNFHAATLFPEDYLPDVHTRLTMYKRIASAKTNHELRDLEIEAIDRFGLLPGPAKTLFRVSEIKLKAMSLGIRNIDLGTKGGTIEFEKNPQIDPISIVNLIQSDRARYAMKNSTTLSINVEAPEIDQRLSLGHEILAALGAEGK